jgi:uncharacterized protein YndB with AHSA1/START domain
MWEGSEQVFVAASPETVWAIVTDVARHPALAGSGEIATIRLDGPVSLGSRWEADIRVPNLDEPFVARSEVLIFDPPIEFCWTSEPPPFIDGEPDSAPHVTWWFRLTPQSGGTLVENAFRVVEPKVGAKELADFFESTNRVDSILAGVRGTLGNLKVAAEAAQAARDTSS